MTEALERRLVCEANTFFVENFGKFCLTNCSKFYKKSAEVKKGGV